MMYPGQISADDILSNFNRCVEMLNQSAAIKLNYLETTVNALRVLSMDPKIVKSMNIGKQMEIVKGKFEKLPTDEMLIREGSTDEDIRGVRDAEDFFQEMWSIVCEREPAGQFTVSSRAVDQVVNGTQPQMAKDPQTTTSSSKATFSENQKAYMSLRSTTATTTSGSKKYLQISTKKTRMAKNTGASQEKHRERVILRRKMKTPTKPKSTLRETNTAHVAKKCRMKEKNNVTPGTSKRKNTIKSYESISSNEPASESSEPTSSLAPTSSDISSRPTVRVFNSVRHRREQI
jgi:hypothetical protein